LLPCFSTISLFSRLMPFSLLFSRSSSSFLPAAAHGVSCTCIYAAATHAMPAQLMLRDRERRESGDYHDEQRVDEDRRAAAYAAALLPAVLPFFPSAAESGVIDRQMARRADTRARQPTYAHAIKRPSPARLPLRALRQRRCAAAIFRSYAARHRHARAHKTRNAQHSDMQNSAASRQAAPFSR